MRGDIQGIAIQRYAIFALLIFFYQMKNRSARRNKNFYPIAFIILPFFLLCVAFKSNAQAPVITNSAVNVAGITEDILTASNTGTLVSTLMSGTATDVNGDAIGI